MVTWNEVREARLRPFHGRCVPNFLAATAANAEAVYEAARKTALIGVMTARFPDTQQCIHYVNELLSFMPAVSVGLGDGDPGQWARVVEVARATNPGHVNQVFPAAGFTAGVLKSETGDNIGSIVNALVRPTGRPGEVEIATGPLSSRGPGASVDAGAAAAMLAEVGVSSIKFYPMQGRTRLQELAVLVRAAADRGIVVVEPTGGLDETNVADIVKTCLDAGAELVIPHLYGSMIDPDTGLTSVAKVEQVMAALDRVLSS